MKKIQKFPCTAEYNEQKEATQQSEVGYMLVPCFDEYCNEICSERFFFAHAIKKHAQTLTVRAAYEGIQCQMPFDATKLKFEEVQLIAVLGYGGDGQQLPGDSGLCCTNVNIQLDHLKWSRHLPIFVLAYQTSWNSIYNAADERDAKAHVLNENDFVIIWCVTLDTIWPIKCSIAAINTEYETEMRAVFAVRRMRKTQKPKEFYGHSSNYLQLPAHMLYNLPTDKNILAITIQDIRTINHNLDMEQELSTINTMEKIEPRFIYDGSDGKKQPKKCSKYDDLPHNRLEHLLQNMHENESSASSTTETEEVVYTLDDNDNWVTTKSLLLRKCTDVPRYGQDMQDMGNRINQLPIVPFASEAHNGSWGFADVEKKTEIKHDSEDMPTESDSQENNEINAISQESDVNFLEDDSFSSFNIKYTTTPDNIESEEFDDHENMPDTSSSED